MSRQAISGQRHILRALAQWPKDTVRPQIQFQDILTKRFEELDSATTFSAQSPSRPSAESTSFTAASAGEIKPPTPGTTTPAPRAGMSEKELLAQANALYGLLGDRFKRKYPIQHGLLTPRSKPTHFTDLVRELEEGPKRSFVERFMVRMKGLVRYQ